MLNAEKYKDRILEVASNDKVFGIDRKNNKIDNCSSMNCRDCLFYTFGTISEHDVNRIKWLLSEYKDPIKLTRLEYEILKYILNHTEYKYITRDRIGAIFIYENKPEKNGDTWRVLANGGGYTNLTILDELFKFIKWEDSKPRSIEEILKKCVVENIKEEQ